MQITSAAIWYTRFHSDYINGEASLWSHTAISSSLASFKLGFKVGHNQIPCCLPWQMISLSWTSIVTYINSGFQSINCRDGPRNSRHHNGMSSVALPRWDTASCAVHQLHVQFYKIHPLSFPVQHLPEVRGYWKWHGIKCSNIQITVIITLYENTPSPTLPEAWLSSASGSWLITDLRATDTTYRKTLEPCYHCQSQGGGGGMQHMCSEFSELIGLSAWLLLTLVAK